MKRRHPLVLLAALAVAASLGCVTSAVSRGAELYRQGRHIDADLVFEHGEPQLAQLDPGERARYALYRGANYLALGERQAASRWLAYGAGLSSAAATTALSTEERELLLAALLASGHGPNRSVVSVDGGEATPAGAASRAGPGLVVRAARLSP